MPFTLAKQRILLTYEGPENIDVHGAAEVFRMHHGDRAVITLAPAGNIQVSENKTVVPLTRDPNESYTLSAWDQCFGDPAEGIHRNGVPLVLSLIGAHATGKGSRKSSLLMLHLQDFRVKRGGIATGIREALEQTAVAPGSDQTEEGLLKQLVAHVEPVHKHTYDQTLRLLKNQSKRVGDTLFVNASSSNVQLLANLAFRKQEGLRLLVVYSVVDVDNVRLFIRSVDDHSARDTAIALGGNGYPNAAGATIDLLRLAGMLQG